MIDTNNVIDLIDSLIESYKSLRRQLVELLDEHNKNVSQPQWLSIDIVPNHGERVVIVRKGCIMFDVYLGFWLPGTECWLRLPEVK